METERDSPSWSTSASWSTGCAFGDYNGETVFTHGADGVCIDFKREALLAALPIGHQLIAGPVTYRKIGDLKNTGGCRALKWTTFAAILPKL